MLKRRRRFRRRFRIKKRRYRSRRYIRPAYKRNIPEVKSRSWEFDGLKLYEDYKSTADSTMYVGFGCFANLLAGIPQGSGPDERIGNRIFIKSIRFDYVGAACPDASNTSTVIDNFYYRPMVTTAKTILSNVLYYFNIANKIQFNGTISRKNQNVYFDKIIKVPHGAWVASNISGSSMDKECGSVFHGRFVLPLNRQVEYNTSGGPKNDRDVITLHHIGFSPWCMRQTSTGSRQIACVNYKLKVYYTDS